MSVRLNLLILASRLLVRPVALRADPIKLRADFERGAVALLRCPPYTCLTPTRFAPGLSGLAIRSRPGSRPPHPGRVMLWFHGGAFVAGSPRTHAGLLARLARMGRLEVVAPAYRLAPEHPFPAAVEDALTAFDGLVARGYAPGNIVIGGDSAGGNFALGLLAGLLGDGVRPAGVVALSPVTDLTFSGASIAANAVRDPMLPAARRGYGPAWPNGPRTRSRIS